MLTSIGKQSGNPWSQFCVMSAFTFIVSALGYLRDVHNVSCLQHR